MAAMISLNARYRRATEVDDYCLHALLVWLLGDAAESRREYEREAASGTPLHADPAHQQLMSRVLSPALPVPGGGGLVPLTILYLSKALEKGCFQHCRVIALLLQGNFSPMFSAGLSVS
ncbi:UNVERIFIED_CONTAM: hypothetical protein K2H54_019509 [Gekko kuhli]